jgi:hypothetical protein
VASIVKVVFRQASFLGALNLGPYSTTTGLGGEAAAISRITPIRQDSAI